MTSNTHTFVDDETFAALLGEGIHTGLRKGSEAPSSVGLWRAIDESDDGAWDDALRFAVDGLKMAGYRLVREAS